MYTVIEVLSQWMAEDRMDFSQLKWELIGKSLEDLIDQFGNGLELETSE